MPVANKNSTFLEESAWAGPDEDSPAYLGLDRDVTAIWDDIITLLDKNKANQEEEQKSKRKLDRYNQAIAEAEEAIAKAMTKREALLNNNTLLKQSLDKFAARKQEALEYWANYGLEITQMSKEQDNFQQYAFKFTKPPAKGNSTVNLRFQNSRLEIVEQMPNILSLEDLTELNKRLTECCVQEDDFVDYKLAMLMIRKALAKGLSPPRPKTSSHQPAETNNHTDT